MSNQTEQSESEERTWMVYLLQLNSSTGTSTCMVPISPFLSPILSL